MGFNFHRAAVPQARLASIRERGLERGHHGERREAECPALTFCCNNWNAGMSVSERSFSGHLVCASTIISSRVTGSNLIDLRINARQCLQNAAVDFP